MIQNPVWHGCQLVMWAVAGLTDAAPPAREVARVRSKVFDIDYRVNESALPLETVRMWYTVDKGVTWQLYGAYEDNHSPTPGPRRPPPPAIGRPARRRNRLCSRSRSSAAVRLPRGPDPPRPPLPP